MTDPADDAPLPPGAILGRHRIERLIGSGGTGELYRARDPRLGRDVALKVLRRVDEHRAGRERLLEEARAAARLNHPNICTIHEIGQAAGHDYVVFEYIEGETLAGRRQDGGLSLGELIDWFLPMSEALDYAHRRGLVHRDLKPTNVMVSALGLPKILDFGVAKAVAGTAGYRAPEQALGQPVDARTDVFAFGCVLYELATGRRAFDGPSPAAVSDAAAHQDVEPLSRLRPDLPAALAAIVHKCLRTAPAARYQRMSDVAAALRGLRPGHTSAPMILARRGIAVLAGAALLAAVLVYHRLARDAPVPRLVRPSQVTVAVSLEDHPTWSPDGRALAFESNESSHWDIWVASLGGEPAVNRTADHPGDDRYPSWSPDGRQIAFWSDRGGGGYYVVPALGGSPVRVAATLEGRGAAYHSPPQWSPDGTELAYVMYEAKGALVDSFVETTAVATRATRRVRLPGHEECRLDLTWSRDGRYLAYVDAAQQLSETTQLRVLRLADGESTAVTDDRANVRGPNWSPDGRHLYFSANRVGPSDLWRRRIGYDGVPAGGPEQVTTAVEVRHAAFSADGMRMAFSKGRWVANIWRVPILADRPSTWADAEPITSEQAYIEFMDVSRDGTRLLFSSDRAGNQDLWTMAIGGEMTRLTADPAPEWSPRWSPGEREIAFYSSRTGDREIWVMPAAGGAARQLTRARGLDAGSEWAPDGRTIAFRSERTGNSEIWTVTSDGSEERQLTRHPADDYTAVYSPDGRWLVFASTRGGSRQLWRMPAEGGAATLLSRIPATSPVWSPDGARLYFRPTEGPASFWSLSAEDGRAERVADLSGQRGTLTQRAATDGKSLYFSWRSDVGDIWVMDVDRE